MHKMPALVFGPNKLNLCQQKFKLAVFCLSEKRPKNEGMQCACNRPAYLIGSKIPTTINFSTCDKLFSHI